MARRRKPSPVVVKEIHVPLSIGYVQQYTPLPIDKTYRSKDIQQIAQVSKMQLVHWTQTGAIIPLKDAKGRGGRRVYSLQNLLEALVCRELNQFSIETHVMRTVLNDLREKKWKFVFTIEPGTSMSLKLAESLGLVSNRGPTLASVLEVKEDNELPISIEKECTLWECLRLIGAELQGFYCVIIGLKKDGQFSSVLSGAEDIVPDLAEFSSAFVIDFFDLLWIAEIG